MTSSLRIIVTGLIAQHWQMPGVTWDYLQYVLGLHRMGHDVYYVEDSGEWPYNLDGGSDGNQWVAHSCERNIRHISSILGRYGLEDKWAYFFPYENRWYGMTEQRRNEIISTADIVINVSGTLQYPERYGHRARLVYIDSDPGFTQLKLLRGDIKFCRRVAAHDIHFSFGENLPDQLTDKLAYNWIPTRTPILLEEWANTSPDKGTFTTVMNWTSYPPVSWGPFLFSQKDTEFIRFLGLPSKVKPQPLQVAMSRLQHSNWQTYLRRIMDSTDIPFNALESPNTLLTSHGWEIVHPDMVCGDFDSYRSYIQGSKAEWSIAKGGYVSAQAGWFSCRSACYLAAGRPVVVQDTGFGKILPDQLGILAFQTLEEAVNAIFEVNSNYKKHARSAVEIADAYFKASEVLGQIIFDTFSFGARKKRVF